MPALAQGLPASADILKTALSGSIRSSNVALWSAK